MEKLNNTDLYKRVYLSVIENEVHLALWYRKHPARKHKQLSLETVNKLCDYFLLESNTIDELDNLDNY